LKTSIETYVVLILLHSLLSIITLLFFNYYPIFHYSS
jgi:hypothetical protein